MHERNAEEKNRYFSEVTRNLQREGLNVLSEQDGFLTVERTATPLQNKILPSALDWWM